MSEPFVLGVNYWPRQTAMAWWSEFDAGEVQADFARVRELGLRVVRIFLLWDDFQPAPGEVSRACLSQLERVCEIANDNALKLDVTFFTGHMSGPNWAPRWLLGGAQAPGARPVVSARRVVQSGYRNPFTDPTALAAERLLLGTVVQTFRQHPAIGMWNLGNEPDLFARPPTHTAGRDWVREMTGIVHELDDAHPVTCGLHTDSLMRDNGLRVTDVFGETDTAVMHAYPMYLPWAKGPLDPWLVPFTCALTSALSGKPTLMEEFGGCTAPPGQPSYTMEWTAYGEPRTQFMASEQDLARLVQETLNGLLRVGASGAALWCFADYGPELWNCPPCDEARHERSFGLVRADGSWKPHAKVVQEFAARAPAIQPTPDWARVKVAADEYYREPLTTLVAAYDKFLQNVPALQ